MTYNDNTVTVGHTYVYRVKAVNGTTSSSLYSNTATVTTSINAPTNLTATLLIGGTSVRLNWTDNANNEANYKVERSDNGGAFNVLTSALPANTITYPDPAVSSPNTYVYRVTATNVNTIPGPPHNSLVGRCHCDCDRLHSGGSLWIGGSRNSPQWEQPCGDVDLGGQF